MSYKITGGIRLVVGRVNNWVWGGIEGVWGCFGGVKGGLLDSYRTLFVPQEVLYGPDLVPNNT